MSIIVRRPWTRQPQTPVGIDWSNPLARGLIFAAPFGVRRASGEMPNPYLINGAKESGIAPFGRGVDLPGGTADAMEFPASSVTCQPEMTWTAIVHVRGLTPAYSAVFACYIDSGNYFQLFIKSNGKLAVYCAGGSQTSNYDGTGVNTLAIGGTYVLSLCFSASVSNLPKAYVNGIEDATASGFASTLSGTQVVHIGRDRNTAGRDLNSVVGGVAVHNRFLTQREIKSLHVNPWQLFSPQTQRIWTPAAAAGAPTLSASTYVTGSLTSTGWRPQVTAS